MGGTVSCSIAHLYGEILAGGSVTGTDWPCCAGKFHMEMVVWHNAHWSTWGRQKYFDNIFPELYETLLPSSLARAKTMGWEGARYETL